MINNPFENPMQAAGELNKVWDSLGFKEQEIDLTAGLLRSNPEMAESYMRHNYENVRRFITEEGKIKFEALAREIERDKKIGKLIGEYFKHNFGVNLMGMMKPELKPRDSWDAFMEDFKDTEFASLSGKNIVFKHPRTVAGNLSRLAAEGHALMHMSFPEGADIVVPQGKGQEGFSLTKSFLREYRAALRNQNPPAELRILSPHQVSGAPQAGEVRLIIFDQDTLNGEHAFKDSRKMQEIAERGAVWSSNEAYASVLVAGGKSPKQAMNAAGVPESDQTLKAQLETLAEKRDEELSRESSADGVIPINSSI